MMKSNKKTTLNYMIIYFQYILHNLSGHLVSEH